MKLQSSPFQSDPHVSFLDVIFCLCVFLCSLLSIMMVLKENASIEEETQDLVQLDDDFEDVPIVIVIEESEQNVVQSSGFESVSTARFRGRGGQPILNVRSIFCSNEGLIFEISEHRYSWFEFRKIICNLDRRELGGQPAMIFQISLCNSYRTASNESIMNHLNGRIDVSQINRMRSEDPNNYIFNIYKYVYEREEIEYREFKKKYTTTYLGNWDSEKIGNRSFTEYEERKMFGEPFLWFTVDEETQKIVLGPVDNPFKVSPSQFVDLIGSIRGGDGFYIEYRSSNTLKYNPEETIPDWVMREVIDRLGFSFAQL